MESVHAENCRSRILIRVCRRFWLALWHRGELWSAARLGPVGTAPTMTNSGLHAGIIQTASYPTGTVMVGGGSYLRNVPDLSTVPSNGLVLGRSNPSTGPPRWTSRPVRFVQILTFNFVSPPWQPTQYCTDHATAIGSAVRSQYEIAARIFPHGHNRNVVRVAGM
jgi:hypothetical protein